MPVAFLLSCIQVIISFIVLRAGSKLSVTTVDFQVSRVYYNHSLLLIPYWIGGNKPGNTG